MSQKIDTTAKKTDLYVPLPPLDLFDGVARNEPNLHAGFRRPTIVIRKDTIGSTFD